MDVLSFNRLKSQRALIIYSSGAGPTEPGGQGGSPPPQILADQLTLFPPEGQIKPATLQLAPPPRIFRPSYGPEVHIGK